MANIFGLNVTAEGVETGAQLEALQAFNCSQAQGYFFSKPVPYEEFCQILEQSSIQGFDNLGIS
jgi:EAL domain-containing protein (putative c-di-GMP-specific phosphodiesterase class I)